MSDTLHVGTYNIHKGFSFFRRRMVIHEVREHLRLLNTDLVFLQEVQGVHHSHARRIHNWPAQPQHEFLADSVWTDFAYGRNAIYDDGHHGNAILSRFPILRWDNQDISGHRLRSSRLDRRAPRAPDATVAEPHRGAGAARCAADYRG